MRVNERMTVVITLWALGIAYVCCHIGLQIRTQCWIHWIHPFSAAPVGLSQGQYVREEIYSRMKNTMSYASAVYVLSMLLLCLCAFLLRP